MNDRAKPIFVSLVVITIIVAAILILRVGNSPANAEIDGGADTSAIEQIDDAQDNKGEAAFSGSLSGTPTGDLAQFEAYDWSPCSFTVGYQKPC